MSEPVLIESRIRAGIWEGVLRAAAGGAAPDVEVTLAGLRLDGATLASLPERPGHWVLRVPIPAAAVQDGIQTFVVNALPQHGVLGHFTIVTGRDHGDDLRAEVALLRAELDLLKRAFRQHCVATEG